MELPLKDWNDYLTRHPEAHILQAGEWGVLKSAFGWQVLRLVNDGVGVQLLFRRLPLGFSLAYIPRPMTAIFSHPDLMDEIDQVCRQRRAVLLKIEPDEWEGSSASTPLLIGGKAGGKSPDSPSAGHRSTDFIPSPHNIQPPRTIVVDLRGSEDNILARMKQKCRYNVRLAEKKGVTVRAWEDVESFHKMVLITGGRDGFGVHTLEYYRQAYRLFHPAGSCELLVAEFEGRPLAALMVFARGKRAWYLYGASTDEERNRMPAYLLQWEAMRWAKGRGCEGYDLWGVPDEDEPVLEAHFERRSDGLWGVYRFKRGFGGALRRSAAAMDKVYNPLLYRLYLWRMAGRESD
jgi:peptidoglycan pentaglycine glycine transferase (the first glycine)